MPVQANMVPGQGEINRLWKEYKTRGGNQTIRDKLIVHYSPLVRWVASRVAFGLPQNVEQSDLVSYGIFGLIDAIEKFDLDRGVKFETYATARIKGAILDEIRAIDWVPRSIRAKARAIETAHTKLEGDLRRTPSEKEVAWELDMTIGQLHVAQSQTSSLSLVPLDRVQWVGAGQEDWSTLGDALPDTRHSPTASYEIDELRGLVARSLEGVADKREKTILALYYHEGLTLAEIGQVLGVTESRVCQIHTSLLLQIGRRTLVQEEL